MTWTIGLLVLIAILLVAVIATVLFIGMAIEERLNRISGTLWEGLHGGTVGPYLAELLKQTRRD